MIIDKELIKSFAKTTERAAYGASLFRGKGDKIAADKPVKGKSGEGTTAAIARESNACRSTVRTLMGRSRAIPSPC